MCRMMLYLINLCKHEGESFIVLYNLLFIIPNDYTERITIRKAYYCKNYETSTSTLSHQFEFIPESEIWQLPKEIELIPESELEQLRAFICECKNIDNMQESLVFKTENQNLYLLNEISPSELQEFQSYFKLSGNKNADPESEGPSEDQPELTEHKFDESVFIEFKSRFRFLPNEQGRLKSEKINNLLQTTSNGTEIIEPEAMKASNKPVEVISEFKDAACSTFDKFYPTLEKTMTIINYMTLLYKIGKRKRKKHNNRRVYDKDGRVILEKAVWNLSELSDKLKRPREVTRKLLKLYGYKWDRCKMLYCKHQFSGEL